MLIVSSTEWEESVYKTKMYQLVKLQFGRSEDAKQPFHCHFFKVYSDMEFLLCCILIWRCMYNHNNDTIKTSDTVLRKIYLSLYLKGLSVRGSWRPNRTTTYWPPLLLPSDFLSRSPGLLNRRPGGSALCWVLFSLQNHFSNSLISKNLYRGPEGSLCWVLAFSTASCLQLFEFPVHWVI